MAATSAIYSLLQILITLASSHPLRRNYDPKLCLDVHKPSFLRVIGILKVNRDIRGGQVSGDTDTLPLCTPHVFLGPKDWE